MQQPNPHPDAIKVNIALQTPSHIYIQVEYIFPLFQYFCLCLILIKFMEYVLQFCIVYFGVK